MTRRLTDELRSVHIRDVRAWNRRRTMGLRAANDSQIIHTGDKVRLTTTPQPFGGVMLWFRCDCGRRCGVLYAGERMECRLCVALTYRSQVLEEPQRLTLRASRIWQRLCGAGNPIPERRMGFSEWIPPRPKGMRWATYDRLLSEAHALDTRSRELYDRQWLLAAKALLATMPDRTATMPDRT